MDGVIDILTLPEDEQACGVDRWGWGSAGLLHLTHGRAML